MKLSLSILFLAIGGAALIGGAVYAATADDAKVSQKARMSEQRPGTARDSEKTQSHRHANLAKVSVPKPPTNSRRRSTGDAVANVHQPVSSRSNVAASGASVARQTGSQAGAFQARTVARSSETSSVTTPHHSPNPARVGGTTSLRAANTGALNGTHMARRP